MYIWNHREEAMPGGPGAFQGSCDWIMDLKVGEPEIREVWGKVHKAHGRDSHSVKVNPQHCYVGLLTRQAVPTQAVGVFIRARCGVELPHTRYCSGGVSTIKTDTSHLG